MFSECLLCTDHSLSMKRKILTCSPTYIFNQTTCDCLYHPSLCPLYPFSPYDTGSWGDLKKLTILTSLKFKTKFLIKKKSVWTGVGLLQSKFLFSEISLLLFAKQP